MNQYQDVIVDQNITITSVRVIMLMDVFVWTATVHVMKNVTIVTHVSQVLTVQTAITVLIATPHLDGFNSLCA
jgi:hypothetical protein